MSNEPKKTLQKIRTFAQDLEMEREKHHLSPTAPVLTETKEPTQKAAAAVAEEVITHTEDIPVKTMPQKDEVRNTPIKEPIIVSPSQAAITPPTNTAVDTQKIHVREFKKDLQTPRTTSGGTIITDNKKVTPGFFSSVITSLNNWITSFKKQKKAASTTYSVVDSERRKGVVQKATTKTGFIFTADSETLAEEIRRRQTIQQPSKNLNEPDLNWTPNTEPGYPLLPESTSNIQVQFKKHSLPQPELVEPTVSVPSPEERWGQTTKTLPPIIVKEKLATTELPTPPKEPIPTQTWEQEPPRAPLQSEPREVPTWATTPPVPPPPTPPAETTAVFEEQEILEDEAVYELTTPEAHYRIRSIGDVTKINTNYLSLGVVGALLGLVVLIFAVRMTFLFFTETTSLPTLEPATPMLEQAIVVDVELSTVSKEAFMIAIEQTDTDTPGIRELRFIKSDQTLLTKEELAVVTGLNAAPRIVQSATSLHFAHVGTKRALIIDVTDPTNALGSLLEWEPTIANGIGALFTIKNPGEEIAFTDVRLEGADVRVATITDTESLVYGFIDQNTILITQSTAAFSEVLANN